MPTANLLLRVMAEVGNTAEAEEVKSGVARQLERTARVNNPQRAAPISSARAAQPSPWIALDCAHS
jgi:hypothetical protein